MINERKNTMYNVLNKICSKAYSYLITDEHGNDAVNLTKSKHTAIVKWTDQTTGEKFYHPLLTINSLQTKFRSDQQELALQQAVDKINKQLIAKQESHQITTTLRQVVYYMLLGSMTAMTALKLWNAIDEKENNTNQLNLYQQNSEYNISSYDDLTQDILEDTLISMALSEFKHIIAYRLGCAILDYGNKINNAIRQLS